jgi:glycosyltransferase involved in cell wall biosynthesis
MRILLDIRHRTTLSGSVSYVYSLLPLLLEAGDRHEFVVLRYRQQTRAVDLPCKAIVLDRQSPLVQMAWDHVSLPRLVRERGIELYHPLKYLGTANPACAQITTLHAITEPYGGDFPGGWLETIYWRHLGRRILRQSRHVIAVSGYLRDFLIDRIGVPAQRITVIPNGVDPRFRPAAAGSNFDDAAPYMAAPYLLTVGNIFPVKNFAVAVRTLAALAPHHPALRLKMAGDTGHPHCREIRRIAPPPGVLDRIDFLGYVTGETLVALMNHCAMLLMPSLTEGCPVTLLEAMASGAPVIAARRGGIPEVGGDAVMLVDDPLDQPAWIAAAAALLNDAPARVRCVRRAWPGRRITPGPGPPPRPWPSTIRWRAAPRPARRARRPPTAARTACRAER